MICIIYYNNNIILYRKVLVDTDNPMVSAFLPAPKFLKVPLTNDIALIHTPYCSPALDLGT